MRLTGVALFSPTTGPTSVGRVGNVGPSAGAVWAAAPALPLRLPAFLPGAADSLFSAASATVTAARTKSTGKMAHRGERFEVFMKRLVIVCRGGRPRLDSRRPRSFRDRTHA